MIIRNDPRINIPKPWEESFKHVVILYEKRGTKNHKAIKSLRNPLGGQNDAFKKRLKSKHWKNSQITPAKTHQNCPNFVLFSNLGFHYGECRASVNRNSLQDSEKGVIEISR